MARKPLFSNRPEQQRNKICHLPPNWQLGRHLIGGDQIAAKRHARRRASRVGAAT
jgi:hypothetical protein